MLKQTHIYKTDLNLSFWICCVTFPQNHHDDPCIPASIHSIACGEFNDNKISSIPKLISFPMWHCVQFHDVLWSV